MEYKVNYSYVTDTDPEQTLKDTVEAETAEKAVEIERSQVCKDILSVRDAIIRISPNGGTLTAYDHEGNLIYKVYDFKPVTVFPSKPTISFSRNEVARYGFFIGDLCNEAVEKISDALRSKKPFNTGWMQTVKGFDSAAVLGDGNGNILIKASTYIGDLEDRIDWIADDIELSVEETTEIYNTVFFDTPGDCIENSKVIVQTDDTTLETVLDEIAELVGSNHEREKEDSETIESYIDYIISLR